MHSHRLADYRTGRKVASLSAQQIWSTECTRNEVVHSEGLEAIIAYCANHLQGTTLDLASGWRNYYPASMALDNNTDCLRANLTPIKILFDLDLIGKYSLPFADKTFDAVTMISVWQYLRSPLMVLTEVLRVLKPESRLHIINNGKSILSLEYHSAHPDDIALQITQGGYDCSVEELQVRGSNTWGTYKAIQIRA